MAVFSDVAPCSLVEIYRRFSEAYYLHHHCKIPEDGHLHIRQRENLKSHQGRVWIHRPLWKCKFEHVKPTCMYGMGIAVSYIYMLGKTVRSAKKEHMLLERNSTAWNTLSCRTSQEMGTKTIKTKQTPVTKVRVWSIADPISLFSNKNSWS
jgi:hypothetical protein